MKKLILLLVVCCPLIGTAQDFTAVPVSTIDETYGYNDWVTDYIYIENTSGTSKSMSFDVVTNTIPGLGWSQVVCTNIGCYPSMPSTGSLGTLAAGDSAYFKPTTGFMEFVGTGELTVKVYETGVPSNSIEITFKYTAVNDVSVGENSILNISAYPNPAVDQISFSGLTSSFDITIYNLEGKAVFNAISSNEIETISVEELESGLYVAKLTDTVSGQSIFKKFNKK